MQTSLHRGKVSTRGLLNYQPQDSGCPKLPFLHQSPRGSDPWPNALRTEGGLTGETKGRVAESSAEEENSRSGVFWCRTLLERKPWVMEVWVWWEGWDRSHRLGCQDEFLPKTSSAAAFETTQPRYKKLEPSCTTAQGTAPGFQPNETHTSSREAIRAAQENCIRKIKSPKFGSASMSALSNQRCKNTLEITAGLWCTTNTPSTVSEDLAPGAPTPEHPCCPCAAAPPFLHSRRFLYVREQNNSIKSPSCQLPALRDEQQIFLDEHLGGDAGHATPSCLPHATQGRNHPCKLSAGGTMGRAGRQPDLGEDRLLRLQDSKIIAPWS